MKNRWVVFAATVLIALLFSADPALAVKYPEPTGYVNDFAKIIPAKVKERLEEDLRIYENRTSIEIVVVTISSLEDLTIDDYTIGLAQKWGVGKKGKDNGVVFLVAPSERKMRIEVGYGLEPDLTDSKAGDIIQDSIVPFFKAGKMPDGVVSGVRGIIATLGDKPFADRVRERQELAEKKRTQDAAAWENFKNNAFFAGMAIAIIALLSFIAWLAYLPTKRRKERERAEKESRELLKIIPLELEKAQAAVANKDVGGDTKRLLQDAKTKYDKGQKVAGNSPADWLMAVAILAAASAAFRSVVTSASYDSRLAEEARRPRPKLAPASRHSSRSSASARSRSSEDTSSSSWSSSNSSFDSGSMPSFGDFGGGSFGGGGASGSW